MKIIGIKIMMIYNEKNNRKSYIKILILGIMIIEKY